MLEAQTQLADMCYADPDGERLPASLLGHVFHPGDERPHRSADERAPIVNGCTCIPDGDTIAFERGAVLLEELPTMRAECVGTERTRACGVRPVQESDREPKPFVPARPARRLVRKTQQRRSGVVCGAISGRLSVAGLDEARDCQVVRGAAHGGHGVLGRVGDVAHGRRFLAAREEEGDEIGLDSHAEAKSETKHQGGAGDEARARGADLRRRITGCVRSEHTGTT